MAVLKKIRAATLVETLVASALVVLVFIVASASFNSIFQGVIKSNDQNFEARLQEITYQVNHSRLELPYSETTKQWEISVWKEAEVVWLEGRFLVNEQKNVELQLRTHE
ncbi:MAG: hypothetical protein AAF466_02385 [Bacteroidota bacterium]